MDVKDYVVATVKPWNVELFQARHGRLPGRWHLVASREELTVERLSAINPRYVFFPHWSWIVPTVILDKWECVCFHMTDLPFGRGGSPLQNLIVRGFKDTKLSALRMEPGLDTGPVYLKRPLKLDGSAEEIYRRAGELVWDVIAEMTATEPKPAAQVGTPVEFARRSPAESILPTDGTLDQVYDHIRMLDAPTYPPAFIDHGAWRLEFAHAAQKDDVVIAQVIIRKREQ